MEDFSKYTDEELDARLADIDRQLAALDAPTQARPQQVVQTPTATYAPQKPIEEMSADELDARLAQIDSELARMDRDAMAQRQPVYDGRNVGNAGAPMRPEDFADDDAMGGVEKVALEAQASGAPVAEVADGSVSSWLKNLWAGVSHNTSGRVAEKNVEMNLQDILRGTVRKDGKDVPLTELPDSELDYLVDAAGWNGAGAWFRRFLGPWARSDEGVMQEWDRTDGARIADPVARKAARVRFAQERARDITLQNEREKQAARAELQGREKQAQAGPVGGLVQTGSYMIPFALPGAHGVMAGLIGGAERGQEMASDRYEMDADGNVRVAAQRDSTGAAVAKGVARGIVEPAIELVGGTLATKALGRLGSATLGKIPLVKSVGGKLAETAVGKVLSRYGKNMQRFGKATGLQGMPEETVEELEDNIFDAVLGIDRRESEKEGSALRRGAEAAKEFFKPESLKNLAESMLLIQILGGGMAHVSDRIRSKPIDNLLAESAGIDKDVLKDYTADEKWAAFDAYVNGLTEEQIREKLGKGADAINDLVDTIAKGKREVDDFRDAALAMFDEGGARQENPSAEEQMRAAGENRAADFMSADEVDAQRRAEEAQNATEAATEAPGTRGAEEAGEETPEAADAPEGENGANAEEAAEVAAETEPSAPVQSEAETETPRAETPAETPAAAPQEESPSATPPNATEGAESEKAAADQPKVAKRSNRLRRGNRQQSTQPTQENPDETGNGAAEAPAQPEQRAERPEAVGEPRQEQGAAQGTEAQTAGVVEAPKAATAAPALAEGYTTKPGTGKSVRVYGPDGKFVGSIFGNGTRYVDKRRLEADEAAPWEPRPEAEAAPATESAATEQAAEPPKPNNRLRPAKTAQAQTSIPNSEKSGGGQDATVPAATQPATQPMAAQSAQSSQRATQPQRVASQSPAQPQTQQSSQPTQQTTQADATQPVVKAGRGRPKKDLVASGTESVRKIMDTARREDGSYDSDKFRYHNANGGLRLPDLKPLYESPDWHTKLGLDEKSAENLRDAVREAYEDAFIGAPNSKGHGAKRKGGYGGLLRHMANLKQKPDDTSQQALTYTAFADAMNKAIEQEDIAGAAILENRMMRLNVDFEAQPHEVQAKVAKAIRRLRNRLTPEERKNMIHFGERERVMEDAAEDEVGDGLTGEGGDEEIDLSHSRANERYDVGVDDGVLDNMSETQREAAEEAARKTAAKNARDAKALRGNTGTGGGRAGNRVLQVQSVDGDDVYVSLLDSTGRDRGLPPQKMSRAQWEMLAKAGKNLNNADPANPQEGDNIMMSRSAQDLPAERAARFAADADYQKWLKRRKAKDAEPLRQRYELKVATWLASVAKRMLPGLKVSVKDRAFDPARDGGEGARRSIGGIFTGTSADYANRSRRGGVDDGPSLLKIGSGEGAQVYGWGLYGSTEKGVAENYANSQYEPGVEINGRRITDVPGIGLAAHTLEYYGNDISKSLAELDDSIRGLSPKSELAKELISARKLIADNRHDIKSSINKPTVYEQTFFTDRAPGDESHLLKWYEPVSKRQKKMILDALDSIKVSDVDGLKTWEVTDAEAAKDLSDLKSAIRARLEHGGDITGEDLYRLFAFEKTPSYYVMGAKAASKVLAKLGIDGIKYPVDSYGGKGVKDGDKVGWNYVSFRDDNIRVDHKWVDGDLRYLREPGSGRVLGTFNRATGELTLFRGANWKTLDHELGGHATLRFAEQEAARGNRALLDRINGIIDSAPQALVDDVKSRYPDADEATLRDEIWAAIREGRESPVLKDFVKTLQGRQWYNRAWDAIKAAWKGLLARMGMNRADLSGIDRMTPDEFNDFLDRTMAEGKTLGRLATEDATGGGRLRRAFAGRVGAKRLGIGKHRVAERMEKDGASREEIWERTGWWRGKDGKWRIEIPDAGFADEFKGDIERARDGDAFDLGSVVDAPELFKAYPELEDTVLMVRKFGDGTRGEYDPGRGVISIGEDLPMDEKRSTLIHELQHAVQTIEGFERGSNVDFEKYGIRNERSKKVAEYKAISEHLHEVARKNGYEKWVKNNSNRLDKLEINVGSLPRKGFDPFIARLRLFSEEVLHGDDQNLFRVLLPQMGRLRGEAMGAKSLEDEAFDRYKRNAGEVESRNAQTRRDYGELERGVIPPWATEDVPEGEQIVLGGEGGASASALAPEANPVRMARAPAPAGSNIMDDVRTGTERARERFLDSHAPIKDVQDEIPGVKEEIRASDGYTDWTKSTDVAAALQKANGRVEHETRGLQRKVDTMARALNGARLDGQSSEELLQDLDLYAQCKHAKERNDTIARRNGVTPDDDYSYGMGEIVRNGVRVGLSANVANDIIAELENKYGRAKFRHMKNAQRALVEINRDDIRRRLESGKLSPSEANYYLYQWSNYVPLKTDVERLEPGLLNSSTAGPKRSEFMKAFGRGTADIADSPVAASLLQAEQGIRGSIRNETANVLANLVERAEAQGLHIGEIVEGIDEAHHGSDYVFTFSDADRVKANAGMQMADKRDDIQLFKRDGKLYAVRVDKGANGRGLDFMRSFKGDNVESWGDGILSKIPAVTHWMSAMRTQYSPEFSVSNYLADSLEAAQALMGRYGVWDGAAAFAKAVAAEIRNAKDVWRYVRRGELRGDVKKAIEAGLLTKGGVASAGFEGKEQDVRLRLDKLRRSAERFWDLSAGDKAKWAWESGKDFIAAANEFMEYSTRIGLFSALHNKGVPVNEAVKFAREATVDFNRKGSFMPIVNGLYMFANASVQGAARAVQAGRESVQNLPGDGSGWGRHKVRGDFIALLVGIGAAKAVIDHFGGNDDDRERKGGRNARNMSEYDKKHNVGIPVGGGRQMPLLRFRGPYAALPYLAQTATNVILGETKPEDALAALPRELTDQITDLVGGNGMINDKGELDWNLLGQSVAPSAIDPIIQLASGKDYKGDERVKRSFDENAPKSWNGKRNTPWPYQKLMQAVNALSGGNSLRKGKIDIAPEDAQLVWEFIWGGLGRDVGNLYSTAQNAYHAAKGGDTDSLLTDMPVVRRLVREYPESTSRYFDALDGYEKDKAEFKGTKDAGRRRELKRARPYLSAEKGRVDRLVERIKELTHLERGEIKRGKSWVEPKMPIGEKQRDRHRKERLRLQAQVLRILGG